MVGSCKNWCSEWASGLTPCIPARHGTCEMFTSSPVPSPFLLLQGKAGENITTPACHLFQGPERQLCAATPRLAAPLPPSHLSELVPWHICGRAIRHHWLKVTELSCPSRESICQEIMIMDHPIPMHATCFPFHTLGRMMNSKRKMFSGAS